MNILQLSKYYPPTHGGLEVVAEFFSRSFFDQGHQTSVLSVGNVECTYMGKFGEQVFQSKETFKINSTPLSLGYFLKFKDILVKDNLQFIFVHLPNPMAHEVIRLNRSLIQSKGIKVIGVYHSDIINQVHLRDAYNLYFRTTMNCYDLFVCSSPNLKNSSDILSSIPNEKVKILPFCIHPPITSKLSAKSQDGNFNFVSIGRMVPYKGYDFLIDVFKELPWGLTIIGNGPDEKKLKKVASSNVVFLGEVSEDKKFEILTNSSALIVSSINRSEAYGMTIVEAFALGIPVIASDIDTGVSFLVKDGERGFRFKIKNKEDFKIKLNQFTALPDKGAKMRNNCLTYYDQYLTYEIFHKNVQKLLCESSL